MKVVNLDGLVAHGFASFAPIHLTVALSGCVRRRQKRGGKEEKKREKKKKKEKRHEQRVEQGWLGGNERKG